MDYWTMMRDVRSFYGLDGPPEPVRQPDFQCAGLAEDFEALAQDDPDMTVCLHGVGAEMVATLSAGRAHPASTRRFEQLAAVAVTRFDRVGVGDPIERWLQLVAKNAPQLIERQAGVGTIHNAAHASGLVVRLLEQAPQSSRTAKDAGEPRPKRRRNRSKADIVRDEGAIGAHLVEHPDATRDQIVEATGIAPAHVSASRPWQLRQAAKREARRANRIRGAGGVGDPLVDCIRGDDDDD